MHAPPSGRARLRFGRYDYAAFLFFAAYAASSLAIPVVLVDMAEDLRFPLLEGGMAAGGAFQVVRSLAMCASMVFAGFAAARWGNRRTLGAAVATMGLGILLCALAPSYLLVLPVLLVAGLGEGIVEGLGTPFVQDMHRDDPGRYVNFTHGFWSLGTFAFALLAGAALVWNVGWRAILAVVGLVALLPVLLLLLPSRTPYPERARADPPSRTWRRLVELLRTRRFWLFFAAMFFAGGGEYCLTFWSTSFVRLHFRAGAFAGALGTAAFSAGMFLGRTGFGNYVAQRHLKRLVVTVGLLGAAVATLVIPFSIHCDALPPGAVKPLLFLLLFLCGVGSAPFWPSIQSLCVDRLPRLDSTLAFIVLSCAGVPGCGVFTWLMGFAGDRFGLARSFALVPVSYLIMVALVLAAAPDKEAGSRPRR
ncbi:MAG: MFS transporter [Kiritimatiellae bacterium]|nr:MFS transporter [Kiritimatiellia bacterium]